MKVIDMVETKKAKRAEKRRKTKQSKKPNTNLINVIDGKEWYNFSIRYAYEGKNWTVDIQAISIKDAWGRLSAMRNFPVEIDCIHSRIALTPHSEEGK